MIKHKSNGGNQGPPCRCMTGQPSEYPAMSGVIAVFVAGSVLINHYF